MTLAIGISGASCTGKGYLCEHLARYFRPTPLVLSMDAYYRDLSSLPNQERDAQNFDCPEAIDRNLLLDHLRRLLRGEEIEMPGYNFCTHTRAPETMKISSGGRIILMEGLFAFYWKEIRDLTRLKVFIELEAKTCLERRIERDTRDRGRTVETILSQFHSRVLPMYDRYIAPTRRYADLVVRGDAAQQDTVERILWSLNQKKQAQVLG